MRQMIHHTPIAHGSSRALSARSGRTHLSLSLLGLLALTACTSTQSANPPAPTPGLDPVLAQLAEASPRAAKAQESLSRVEQKRTPATPVAVDPALVPDELKVPITMDWTGPAHEAVRQIARTVTASTRLAPSPAAR